MMDFRLHKLATRIAAVAVLAASAMALDAALALGQPDSAAAAGPAKAAACYYRHGQAVNQRVAFGNAPPRYSSNGPFLGLSFSSCENGGRGVVRIYYGGFSRATHYNMRAANLPGVTEQIELSVSGRYENVHIVRLTSNPGQPLPVPAAVSVQACRRGGFLQRSSCSPWSARVSVWIGHGPG